MKLKNKNEKGTALLVTLLLAGVISAIAFGMTKITLTEVFVGTKGEEGFEAFYAAQAGIDDALMRFKFHEKTTLEIPADAEKDSPWAVRIFINDNPSDGGARYRLVNTSDSLSRPNPNNQDYYYDLKVWDKENCNQTKPCVYPLDKDGSVLLDVSAIKGELYASWDIVNKATSQPVTIPRDNETERKNTGLWYRLSDPKNPSQIDPAGLGRDFFTFLSYYYPEDNQQITVPRFGDKEGMVIRRSGSRLDVRSARLIKFKAFISETVNGVKRDDLQLKLTLSGGLIGGPKINIESTGYYGDTAKKIVAIVDRESKSIIDVFDYVIYSGQGPLPR